MEAPGSCACECDYEPNRIWNSRIRRARKAHRCEECGAIIEPRELYYYATYLSADGDWGDYTSCLACDRIRRDYAPCCVLGDLRNTIEDCLGFDYITYDGSEDDDDEEDSDG
jgi:hypothetical protein